MKQKITLLFSIITTAVILLVGCNKSSPPTQPLPVELKDTVNISVKDVTHRSVSVNVQSTMNNVQLSVSLYRTFNGADTLVASFPVNVKDTIIIDDDDGAGLLINTSYGYYAVLTDTTGAIKDKTDPITVSTLAPTSHNYTWQEYTIGDAGIQASVLEDVWGTDENNVWAVGGVRINGTQYGVLYWNGTEWIPDSTAGGYAIYGFNNSDIWTVGGGVFHFDGTKWSRVDANDTGQYVVPIDTILHDNIPYSSIWGTSSNNLYLGSGRGKIIHWNGTKARVLNEYDVHITDIYGYDENNIYIVGYKSSKTLIVKTDGKNFTEENTYPGRPLPMMSVYLYSENFLLVGGNGVFKKEPTGWKDTGVNLNGGITKIRGNNTNNIFAVGGYGVVHHFNGLNWHFYNELYSPTGLLYYGVFTTNSKVFIVGLNESLTQAKILIGTNY